MKALSIILGVIALIFLAGFIILKFQYEKIQKQELEEKLKQTEADTAKIKKQYEKYTQEKKENEEKVQQMHAGNNLDSANASIELLQKQSDKGKSRNKN